MRHIGLLSVVLVAFSGCGGDGTGHVYAYNQAMGYLVGTGPDIGVSVDLTLTGWTEKYISLGTEPEDFSDFVGTAAVLAPQSLYEEQLARRL